MRAFFRGLTGLAVVSSGLALSLAACRTPSLRDASGAVTLPAPSTSAAPPRARLHERVFEPTDRSEGRVDGDPELLAAARYHVAGAWLTADQVAARYGADPRTSQLARAWFAEHHLGETR